MTAMATTIFMITMVRHKRAGDDNYDGDGDDDFGAVAIVDGATPSVPSSRAQKYIEHGRVLDDMIMRTNSGGCQRRTSHRSGNRCRGNRRVKTWLERHFRVAEAFDARRNSHWWSKHLDLHRI